MDTHHLLVPYYQQKRRVRVLLPKGYDQAVDQTYPVVYLHDGQNVFYSKESFSGYSWKVIPTIKNHPDLQQVIVVGIDNAGERRLDEYGPWPVDNSQTPEFMEAGGDGMAYGEWVVESVKPFIDSHYRTRPEAQSTLLAGSSMGGIITAYMGAAYPDVFGHLGVFSLASWFSESDFLDFTNAHPLHADTRVFIQVGTNEGNAGDESFMKNSEMNQAYINSTLWYYQSLLRGGLSVDQIDLHIVAEGTHHEKHWADHFLDFLRFSNL